MLSWRMLMITGESKYADLIERTLYNGFLGGLSLDGQKYIYANPLQVREGHLAGGNDGDYSRKPWFHCACCPPNVMRTLASLEHYVLIGDDSELRLHQYITGSYTAQVDGGEATVAVETNYPWQGRVRVLIEATPGGEWALTVRVPHWADGVTLAVNEESVDGRRHDGWLTVQRTWEAGDELILDIPLDVRLTRSDPRVDVNRGAVALERGPLVYCLEAVDNPGHRLDDVVIDTSQQPEARPVAMLDGVVTISTRATVRTRSEAAWWPYPGTSATPASEGSAAPLIAIPYFAWGNRDEGAMRVWIRAGLVRER